MLDLFNRPLRDLRISVTDRCNLRCTYCMPKEVFGAGFQFLPHAELLSFEEIARVAGIFARLGVQKLRITGGEPLVRKNLPQLIAMLYGITGIEDIALTTNGLLLPRHAADLKQAGLNRVTVSLDSLDPETFGKMNGLGVHPEQVLAGIDSAKLAGLSVKINVVVQKGVNDHTVVPLAQYFKNSGCVVRFIEFMDVGNHNGWNMAEVLPSREVLALLQQLSPLEPVHPNYRGEVAKRYKYTDGSGEVGFISSVTEHFCGDCSRIRISSDGMLYTCLFAVSGYDLKTPLRAGESDTQLTERVSHVWHKRSDRYSELRAEGQGTSNKVEMSRVGG